MLAARLLDALLLDEQLTLIDPQGRAHRCGPAGAPARVSVRMLRRMPLWRLLLSPELSIGEAYVRGDLVLETGTLADLMDLVFRHLRIYREERWPRLFRWRSRARSMLGRVTQRNTRMLSARNIHRHYDIGNSIFEAFLDPTMQYTCANFPFSALPAGTEAALAHYGADHAEDLDEAQRRRIAALIAKLRIAKGMRVLDVGCGWGGLALEIAAKTGAEVLGVSISKEQIAYARAKAAAAGLADRVHFELRDYRDLDTAHDRIVAAGILEHIGKPQYRAFFSKLGACLAPDGVLLVDATGRKDEPGGANPWIETYIFPGGYIPSLSEIARTAEKTGLMIHDVEISAMQYALTVREWRRRFAANQEAIRREAGAEFVRSYELYLTASEMAFLHGRYVNMQLVMSQSRFAVPIERAAPP